MSITVFSIDQNCHSLWDVGPKLQALAQRGLDIRHFIEDSDVAFTSLGAQLGEDDLRLVRERFHHSGGADWGSAVFYFEFLGRQPVDVRNWEQLTGMGTKVLAKRLGRSVEDLYDEFSPSDNWQLVGPSYIGRRDYHRIIGDLSVDQTGPFLWEILDRAEANMLATFPTEDSRRRTSEWIASERALLAGLLEACAGGSLVELYRQWLDKYLDSEVQLEVSSRLFACRAGNDRTALLEVFTRKYDLAARLYNEAIEETGEKLRPLRTSEGELPFFVSLQCDGHRVRTGVFLQEGHLRIGDRRFALESDGGIPVEQLTRAGIATLAGKAILLAIQVRCGRDGRPLALPYRGSLYMPASTRLAAKLSAAGLLPGRLHPIIRIRFGFLDRLRSLKTPIRLPEYLRGHFGADVIRADQLGEAHADLIRQARGRLESFRTPAGRNRWQEQNFAGLLAEIERLDSVRRDLARQHPKDSKIRQVWKQIKDLQTRLLDATLQQVAVDYHTAELDYWDSRGAIRPWAIALGGQSFYEDLVENAEVYQEN